MPSLRYTFTEHSCFIFFVSTHYSPKALPAHLLNTLQKILLKANKFYPRNAVENTVYNSDLIIPKISHIPNKGFTTREPLLLLLYL